MKIFISKLWPAFLLLLPGSSIAFGQDDASVATIPQATPTPEATSGLVVPAMPGTVGGSCLCPCPAELTYPQAQPGSAPGTVASPAPNPFQDNWSSEPSSTSGSPYTSKW